MDNSSAFCSDAYDENIRSALPYYDEFYKQIMDVVHTYHSAPLTWLDAGCGTGKMAESAFKEAQIDRFVFCDASAQMIQISKNRFALPQAEFLVKDVQDLDFHNVFDVITAVQVNHYLRKKERTAAISNYFEALKSGGLFITFDNFAPNSCLGKKLCLDRWKAYQLNHGRSEDTCKEHIERYNKDYFPITLQEHWRIMHDCGFQTIEILWASYMQIGILGIK